MAKSSVTVSSFGDVGVFVDEITDGLEILANKGILQAATIAGGHIQKSVRELLTKRPSGALSRSFLPARLISTSAGVAAAALSDLPYAGIQDTGKPEIKPVKAKFLAIPLTNKARKRRPREMKGLFFVTSKKGNKLLALTKRDGKLDPQYLLKKSQKLTGVRYLDLAEKRYTKDLEGWSKEKVEQIVNDAADKGSQ